MGFQDEEAREALIEGSNPLDVSEHSLTHLCPRRGRSWLAVTIPWILTIIFFSTTCLQYWTASTSHPFFSAHRPPPAAKECHCALPIPPPPPPPPEPQRSSSFETGFPTDFVSSSSPIPIRIIAKHFTNDILFNTTSRTLYNVPLSAEEITYIGPPSPTIDAAWHSLLHAQYIRLDPAEVSQIPSDHISPTWYEGEHEFMELAVFHNLHCLNELRIALDQSSGNENGEGEANWLHNGRAHLDHCVDQIRQALMCHADLTPVPMMEIQAGGEAIGIIGNGEPHTCRDFDAIWEWVEERGKTGKAFGD